ncbi:MAG: 3'-5' exonuclease [Erysipelotrichaceae bacterium]
MLKYIINDLQSHGHDVHVRKDKLMKNFILEDVVILDTETTGLDENAEVVELGILDYAGNELFNEKFKPMFAKMSPEASAVNGITNEVLSNAKPFSEYVDQLSKVLEGKVIFCYNTEFDARLMEQTAQLYGQEEKVNQWFELSGDVMQEWQDFINVPNARGTGFKLSEACKAMDIIDTQKHQALGDCDMTLQLLKSMQVKEVPTPEKLLNSVSERKYDRIAACLYAEDNIDQDLADGLEM